MCAFLSRRRRPARIRTAFYVAPRFDQERSGITFPARWLARSPPGADPVLHRMMRERVAELLASADDDDDIVGRVRRQLRTMVTARRCSIEAASEHLGLNVRTLKRHLAAAGTTFRSYARRPVTTPRAIFCKHPDACRRGRIHLGLH